MKITRASYFLFSGGEVHCKLDRLDSRILCTDYSMNGFMALCESNQVAKRKGLRTSLVYPYLPYARQDRVMQPDEPFSLKIFCDLLNTQGFYSVTVIDPHSDVGPALINNCIVQPQWDVALQAIPHSLIEDPKILFISPDAGAYKKLSKLILDDMRICVGVKNRNSEGEITHTNVFGPTSIEGRDCVIVDDICDGGRTFIELAKTLKTKGAKKVYLYVTHGIFSKGFLELSQCIDHIYTTNTFSHLSLPYALKGLLTVVDII